MYRRIYDEVPDAQGSLISVRENLIGVLNLVCYKLVEFSAFELHLLFEILLFDRIITAFF